MYKIQPLLIIIMAMVSETVIIPGQMSMKCAGTAAETSEHTILSIPTTALTMAGPPTTGWLYTGAQVTALIHQTGVQEKA